MVITTATMTVAGGGTTGIITVHRTLTSSSRALKRQINTIVGIHATSRRGGKYSNPPIRVIVQASASQGGGIALVHALIRQELLTCVQCLHC
ncbi:hypothetical protein LZF93_02005 [Bifidobacterium longum]|nr:hypothetical protein LZF93_02005 [Bifidobacterium longum]